MPTRDEIDAARAKRIEDMLLHMWVYERGLGCPNRMFFDGAIPATESTLGPVLDNAGHNLREMNERAASLSKIEGVALFGSDGQPDRAFTLIGCRPMSYDEKKRLLRAGSDLFKSPPGLAPREDLHKLMNPFNRMLQIRQVAIDTNGHGVATAPGYMIRSGEKEHEWLEFLPGETIGDTSLAWLGYGIGVGVSFTAVTTWSVNLRIVPESPGLCFMTDPTGIREFFRFRDVPEGKEKRAALVTWVTDHWRASRHSPEDEVYVREHLRGAREFSWRSLAGSIHIPVSDVKKEEEVKEKRKRMPAAEAIRRRKMQR